MNPPVLLSVLPELHAGTGHVYGYHLSVAEAARQAGWDHEALVPRDHGIDALPPGWHAVLEPGDLAAGLPAAVRALRPQRLVADGQRFAASLHQAVAPRLERADRDAVVFLERFNGPQLLAAARGIRSLPRERLQFWLMFRQDLRSAGIMGRAYAWAARRIAREWQDRFRLLTDSEPLARELQGHLGLQAHVMPIPHTRVAPSPPGPKGDGEIVCWWPGAPRPEKGLAPIQAFAAAHDTGSRPVRLVVAQDADVGGGGAVRVEKIPSRIDDAAYGRWLGTADYVLLPYEPARYRYSTSGIFAEAVVAGSIPLVTAGTWMAQELERHGVAELALDWREPARIPAMLATLRGDAGLRARLDAMRAHYAAYHCEASYARALQSVRAAGG
ncbi:hypothetical protein [Ramlibacter sp. PS4R-6]|uniref:hypothetical protein n=1 Tax=Ramlibacter sp. PS4R-6 TaxID=3133438 RepID=UPI0030A1D5B8